MVSAPSLTICVGFSMPAFLRASSRKKTSSASSSAMRIVLRLVRIGESPAIARENKTSDRTKRRKKVIVGKVYMARERVFETWNGRIMEHWNYRVFNHNVGHSIFCNLPGRKLRRIGCLPRRLQ